MRAKLSSIYIAEKVPTNLRTFTNIRLDFAIKIRVLSERNGVSR